LGSVEPAAELEAQLEVVTGEGPDGGLAELRTDRFLEAGLQGGLDREPVDPQVTARDPGTRRLSFGRRCLLAPARARVCAGRRGRTIGGGAARRCKHRE